MKRDRKGRDFQVWAFSTRLAHLIHNTSTGEAPWHVIPANNRWFARIVVAATIIETVDELDLKFPAVDGKALTELKKVRH
jgi:polyphosphate kinase 2 (PPK2 family)